MAELCPTEDDDDKHSTAVSGTLFSKSWILSLLIKLIEAVEDTPELSYNEIPLADTEGITECTNNDETLLNEDLEADLCQLWDLSINSEVALFLNEHHAIQLIVGTILRSSCNRLTEICVGILNNMACTNSICANKFSDSSSIELFLSLLSHTDAGVLTESTRLMITCLSCDKAKHTWLTAVKSSTTALDDITFILQSSTNENLLKNTSVLLDNILDQDMELLSNWSSSINLIKSICEAINQCADSCDIACTFMLTLQLFTTVDTGADSLMKVSNEICYQVVRFLQMFSDNFDTYSNEVKRSIASSLSLIHFLLENLSPSDERDIIKDKLAKNQTFIMYLKLLLHHNDNSDINSNIVKLAKDVLFALR